MYIPENYSNLTNTGTEYLEETKHKTPHSSGAATAKDDVVGITLKQ